ncbi:cysteine synthase [Fusibacter sp. 3D3]|nr:cysteine synthase [Fusibacter sp. 3D3]
MNKMIKSNVRALVGNTPIVKLEKITTEDMAAVYVKLEGFNVTGSVKVRPALGMIEGAEKRGDLKPGMVIVEPTSGNTGIALAYIGKMKGYDVKIVMPDTMSVERRNIIKAYGAELILTDGTKGMSGAIQEATLMAEDANVYMPQQFNNGDNSAIHYETTGVEIIRDFDALDAFVATVGTGGTITGVGKRLKEHYASLEVFAVEPVESSVLSGDKPGPHKIQGIGAGFVPDVLEINVYNEVLKVSSEDAFKMTKRLMEEEGLFLGISSGAAVVAALEIALRLGKGKKVLTLSPDGGEKYISNNVF